MKQILEHGIQIQKIHNKTELKSENHSHFYYELVYARSGNFTCYFLHIVPAVFVAFYAVNIKQSFKVRNRYVICTLRNVISKYRRFLFVACRNIFVVCKNFLIGKCKIVRRCKQNTVRSYFVYLLNIFFCVKSVTCGSSANRRF